MTSKEKQLSQKRIKKQINEMILRLNEKPQVIASISVILHIFIIGYHFPFSDNYLQLALSKKHQNPNLYPNDPGMSQGAYQSIFWEVMGRIVFWEKSWIVFFLLFLISLWTIYYLLWYIGKEITRESLGGTTLVFLLISPKFGLANVLVIDSWLSLRDISFPFVLLAFYLYLKQRKAWAYFLLGISFNLHPISSYNFAFILLFSDTLNAIRKQGNWKLVLKAVISYLIGSTPLVVTYVMSVLNRNGESISLFAAPQTWLMVMHYRSYFHVFPFEYYPIYYVLALGYLAVYYVYYWYTMTTGKKSEYDSFFMDALGAIMTLFMVNLVFSELIPSFFIIQLQFGRITRFLPFFAMILVASLVTITTKRRSHEGATIVSTIILTMYFSYVIIDNPIIPLILASMIVIGKIKGGNVNLLVNTITLKPQRRKLLYILEVGWIILLILFPVVFHDLFPYPVFQGPQPKPDYNDPWIDVQIWGKEHTNTSSVFVTPPQLSGFRVYSERPIIGEWKDGTLAFFNVSYAGVWWSRMQDLGYNSTNYLDYGFQEYKHVNFTLLQVKYHANYIIYRVIDYLERPLPYSVLYRNTEFMVLVY